MQLGLRVGGHLALTGLTQMTQSELSHMAGAVDDGTINIVVVIIIIIIIGGVCSEFCEHRRCWRSAAEAVPHRPFAVDRGTGRPPAIVSQINPSQIHDRRGDPAARGLRRRLRQHAARPLSLVSAELPPQRRRRRRRHVVSRKFIGALQCAASRERRGARGDAAPQDPQFWGLEIGKRGHFLCAVYD